MDKKNMIKCNKNNCTISIESCFKRQILSRREPIRFLPTESRLAIDYSKCKECEEGIKLVSLDDSGLYKKAEAEYENIRIGSLKINRNTHKKRREYI